MPLDMDSRGNALDSRGALALLQRTGSEHARTALAGSFGAEDMVLTDLIANRATGSFILIDEVTNNTVAAGLIQ